MLAQNENIFSLELKKARKRGPTQVNQSLRDGLEVLLELAKWQRPVGSREVARVLDWDHARVHRFLTTLADNGFAEKTSDRKYIAGPGLMVLATMGLHNSRVFRCALPFLQELEMRTEQPVSLGVRWRRYVSYLFHGDVTDNLNAAIVPGNLYPAERSSIGLALLARLHDDEIRNIYSNPKKHKDSIDINALMERIHRARRQGYAVHAQYESVAVPLDETSETGLCLIGLNEEMLRAKVDFYVQELHRTARKIEQHLKRA
ncbi:helix-turn-helix domain-containing protein [Candidatus Sumerlaeota bacterium]|nr:helix-turn-helix domain-containing protein [Candidatus Sumerlaeota bacterium]